MKITIKGENNEILVNAENVSLEQINYILNYLGRTHKENGGNKK